MVQLLKFVSLLAATVSATQITWDPAYSRNTAITFGQIACSDGANGLATKYKLPIGTPLYQGLAPHLKDNVYFGGASEITGWNHPSCGKCFRLKYRSTGKQILFVGLDVAPAGANLGPDAFSGVSPTGNTDPGRLEVIVYEQKHEDCFKD
ncbi:hypothetical protein TWF696_000782 [Orbilia brochopaga]|uniref:Uncharacterized protein n=1 Tax=Orbilia brochopaga TaxID=3140254 RepID=A0AAV9VDI4_9PEZI